MLRITTKSYKYYQVNEKGQIKPERNWEFSGEWTMLGLTSTHSRSNEFIPFADLATILPTLTLLYKNGKPRYTIIDLDHGHRRHWGDGVISLYFEETK